MPFMAILNQAELANLFFQFMVRRHRFDSDSFPTSSVNVCSSGPSLNQVELQGCLAHKKQPTPVEPP